MKLIYTCSLGVRLGEYNTDSDQDCVDEGFGSKYCSDSPVDVEVEKVISHEDYDHTIRGQYNDIALIRLKRDVQYTGN